MKRTAFALMLVLVLVISAVIAAFFHNLATQPHSGVTILPDGSVVGTSLVQRQSDTYILTGNLSCTVYVQRSNIVIDGAGYAINGGGEASGIDLSNECWRDSSRPQIKNVTVKNLKITNWSFAIEFVASANDTFIGNYVADCYIGFNIWWTHNHTLMQNTIENCVTGITISFGGGGNVILENNIMNSSVFVMEQSPDNTVNRNYWSDYTERYPNATEIDNKGIWDMPYEGHEAFTDNHPLIEPVAANPKFTDEEPLPMTLALAIVAVVVAAAGLLVYFNRRHRKAGDRI